MTSKVPRLYELNCTNSFFLYESQSNPVEFFDLKTLNQVFTTRLDPKIKTLISFYLKTKIVK